MTDLRANLDAIRTEYQVPDDLVIRYHPRVFGAIDIPFSDWKRMTETEGALLDRLTLDRGVLGLGQFRDIYQDTFAQSAARFPDNPVPSNIPDKDATAWQGNDGHRDAFRHAYWTRGSLSNTAPTGQRHSPLPTREFPTTRPIGRRWTSTTIPSASTSLLRTPTPRPKNSPAWCKRP